MIYMPLMTVMMKTISFLFVFLSLKYFPRHDFNKGFILGQKDSLLNIISNFKEYEDKTMVATGFVSYKATI